MRISRFWLLLVPGILTACAAPVPVHAQAKSEIKPVPRRLKVSSYYKKYLDAGGFAVVGSDKVDDTAFLAARNIINEMLANRPDIRRQLTRNGTYIGIIAQEERTTDQPELHYLKRDKKVNWDERARGMGMDFFTSCAEENLIGLPGDVYHGESIFIHEFAHTVMQGAVERKQPAVRRQLVAAYRAAMKKGLWKNTYTASNPDEYWAGGVQCYFDALQDIATSNGIHNEINTREELMKYDPALAKIVASVFPTKWRWKNPQHPAEAAPLPVVSPRRKGTKTPYRHFSFTATS